MWSKSAPSTSSQNTSYEIKLNKIKGEKETPCEKKKPMNRYFICCIGRGTQWTPNTEETKIQNTHSLFVRNKYDLKTKSGFGKQRNCTFVCECYFISCSLLHAVILVNPFGLLMSTDQSVLLCCGYSACLKSIILITL